MLQQHEQTTLQKAEAAQHAVSKKVLSSNAEVRIEHAALEDNDRGDIVLRGTVAFESMGSLRADWYQREVLTSTKDTPRSLLRAIKDGKRFPGVTLSMRGQRFYTKGEIVVLQDPVYIVDGLQRISAMRHYLEINPEALPACPLGCEVNFGKDDKWEAEEFEILNAGRIAVARSIYLRNRAITTHGKDANKGLLTLYGLSKSDTSSVIFGRVCWDQRMKRGELITAVTLAKVADILHWSYTGTYRSNIQGTNAVDTAGRLDMLSTTFGLPAFRANVTAFFDAVDAIYGIRDVQYAKRATHLKGNFILTLAYIFGKYENFWHGNKLFISRDAIKKLRSFAINDPEVVRLSSAGGMASPILFNLLTEHYNSGKRSASRLAERKIKPILNKYRKNAKPKG